MREREREKEEKREEEREKMRSSSYHEESVSLSRSALLLTTASPFLPSPLPLVSYHHAATSNARSTVGAFAPINY